MRQLSFCYDRPPPHSSSGVGFRPCCRPCSNKIWSRFGVVGIRDASAFFQQKTVRTVFETVKLVILALADTGSKRLEIRHYSDGTENGNLADCQPSLSVNIRRRILWGPHLAYAIS